VWIANTHLGLTSAERLAQVTELLSDAWLGRVPADEPLIFCGDFNMVPGSAPYKLIASKLRDVQVITPNQRPLLTFVSTYPITRIDYVFVNDLVQVESLRAPRNSITVVASDHLPLIADLKIAPARDPVEPLHEPQHDSHRKG
jgi:endonuclease/exonuclease/phosphatase family metal-dependent hydrolase